MKAIINGKQYNTETAELLGEARSPLPKSDFGWWNEELYRTPKGAYFLAGEGHASSSWATHHGRGERGPGSGIRALTEEEAKEWAERYLDADEYLEIFPADEA